MIDHMNRTMHKHIVTIEDPIEFLHRDRNSIINQREVGQDTASFKRALRRVLRQDPDVILVGEMRDEETVHTALSAAETGHLVLSTLHTVDAPETINRIIDFFPPHQQQQARAMIAGTLKGVISQRLVPHADGNGRVAVCEILRHDRPRARHDHGPEADRQAAARSSPRAATTGCRPSTRRCSSHLQAGRVTMEDAMRAATSPHDFKLMVAAQARIGPRSHPNKGAGEISGTPADTAQAAPAPHRRSAGGSRPGCPGRRAAPAVPRSRPRRLRRRRLRRPARLRRTPPRRRPAPRRRHRAPPPTPSAPPPGIPS